MKRIFFAHTWSHDEQGRCNHHRVLELASSLRSKGWATWVDEESGDVHGCLDVALATGISSSAAVAVCITEAYVQKLDAAARSNSMTVDNCLKELLWIRMQRKPVVPVVMEPSMLDMTRWGMIAGMGFGGFVYASAIEDPADATQLHTLLCNVCAGGPLPGERLLQRRRRRPPLRLLGGGKGSSPSLSPSLSSSLSPSLSPSLSSDPVSSRQLPRRSSSESVLSVRLSL